jgi:uncharacterized protein YqeY
MTLKEKLTEARDAAIKARRTLDGTAAELNEIKIGALRSVLADLQTAETLGSRHELKEEEIISVLRKAVKQRKDSAEIYSKAGEKTRADKELIEASEISEFLPKLLDEEATREVVAELIKEKNLEGPRAIGALMGALKSRADIDRGLVARIAKELL